MKKKLTCLLLVVCVVAAVETVTSQGLNFANPYGKVPAKWFDRSFWSTIVAWVSAALGLILIWIDKWQSTHT